MSDEISVTRCNIAMNQTTQSHKDLVVWQKGIALAKTIYELTNKDFPEGGEVRPRLANAPRSGVDFFKCR